jgi:hypothetical protein
LSALRARRAIVPWYSARCPLMQARPVMMLRDRAQFHPNDVRRAALRRSGDLRSRLARTPKGGVGSHQRPMPARAAAAEHAEGMHRGACSRRSGAAAWARRLMELGQPRQGDLPCAQ